MSGLLAHELAGAGDGPPVLLLNGGLMSMAAWEPVASVLERHHRVLRCDLRGQLLSPGEPPRDLAGHVGDVVAVLDALGVERVHAVGASYGGLVAVLLAARAPERVASLAAVNTTDRITPEAWADTERLRDAALAADGSRVFDLVIPTTYTHGYINAKRDVLAVYRQSMAALPPAWFAGLAGLLGALQGLDLTPDLPRISCPALVVAGELDGVFPRERSEVLAARIPGARLEVVSGAPHGLVVENAAALAEILERFIRAVESRD